MISNCITDWNLKINFVQVLFSVFVLIKESKWQKLILMISLKL